MAEELTNALGSMSLKAAGGAADIDSDIAELDDYMKDNYPSPPPKASQSQRDSISSQPSQACTTCPTCTTIDNSQEDPDYTPEDMMEFTAAVKRPLSPTLSSVSRITSSSTTLR